MTLTNPEIRDVVLKKGKKLKESQIEQLKKVYIKRDTNPMVRKELTSDQVRIQERERETRKYLTFYGLTCTPRDKLVCNF